MYQSLDYGFMKENPMFSYYNHRQSTLNTSVEKFKVTPFYCKQSSRHNCRMCKLWPFVVPIRKVSQMWPVFNQLKYLKGC